MTSKKTPALLTMEKLTSTLDDALALLKESSYLTDQFNNGQDTPASLLDQCLALCAQHKAVKSPKAIRTIHHFACTGGTLISKCIAAMPNTQLLSEVDPLSDTVQTKGNRFAPTDIITLMRQSTKGINPRLIIDLFLNNLETVYTESVRLGQRLVLRDHAHGHFCTGSEVPDRPSLRQIIVSKFDALSLVTVRHPIDSFLSLEANGWLHFKPVSFDEYCRRYIAFLNAYEGVPIIRYEDFVHNPDEVMCNICEILNIPFNDQFCKLFNVFKISGDSGRKGNVIKPRSRRPVAQSLSDEIVGSDNYRLLREILQYEA